MLQELAARSGGSAFAIASMLFFIAVFVVITVRVVRARREDMEARARLALEGDHDHATPGSQHDKDKQA